MGNKQTALTQFCSPPEPPTPLSPKKYFWIENRISESPLAPKDGERKDDQDAADDGETATTALTCGSDELTGGGSCGSDESVVDVVGSHPSRRGVRSAIPVVYITGHGGGGKGDVLVGSSSSSRDAGGRFTLLFCHGQDVDLGMIYDDLVLMSKLLGVDVLSFDYAGYGLSRLRGTGRRRRQSDDDSDSNAGDSSPRQGESGMVLIATVDRQAEGGEGDEEGEDKELEGKEGEVSFDAADVCINESPPTEEQCCSDILNCYNYLIEQRNVPPQNIILYGKSLGSGPVCWLAHWLLNREKNAERGVVSGGQLAGDDGAAATRKDGSPTKRRRRPTPVPGSFLKSRLSSSSPLPLGGIVLHSAFLSVARLKRNDASTFPRPRSPPGEDAFDNASALRGVLSTSGTLPIYLMHGKDDEVVPFDHAKDLYDLMISERLFGFPPFWAQGATHCNLEHKYANAYIKRLQQFARHCARVNGELAVKDNAMQQLLNHSAKSKGQKVGENGQDAAMTSVVSEVKGFERRANSSPGMAGRNRGAIPCPSVARTSRLASSSEGEARDDLERRDEEPQGQQEIRYDRHQADYMSRTAISRTAMSRIAMSRTAMSKTAMSKTTVNTTASKSTVVIQNKRRGKWQQRASEAPRDGGEVTRKVPSSTEALCSSVPYGGERSKSASGRAAGEARGNSRGSSLSLSIRRHRRYKYQ